MSDGRSTSRRNGALLRALLVCCGSLWLGAGGGGVHIDAPFGFSIGPQKLSTALGGLSRPAKGTLVSGTHAGERFASAGVAGRGGF